MRIFDGQHRRRAIQDTLDRLGKAEDQIDRLTDLQGSSVSIVLYAEDDIGALRQMFTDASKTKRIEANVVTRFDKRDPFNLAAMHLVDESQLFGGRVELDGTTVARGSQTLISVNQLAQAIRVMTVGYRSRVSRAQNDLYMQDLDGLYESSLAWSDEFMPNARGNMTAFCQATLRMRTSRLTVLSRWHTAPPSCASSLGAITTGWKKKTTGRLWPNTSRGPGWKQEAGTGPCSWKRAL